MHRITSVPATRRTFLRAGAGLATTGLVIGLRDSERNTRARTALAVPATATAPASDVEFMPNAFLRIAPDNSVTVISKHVEWGMGIHTGLATIIAEELDADWEQMRVEPAPADPIPYTNAFFGGQATGGSTSIRNSYEQHRQAGAMARAMLVSAAAADWGVVPGEITVTRGVVSHEPSRRSATFGELAVAAAAVPPPVAVPLKDPATFTLIGAEGTPRLDNQPKINGTAEFAFDVALPGMLTALVARPPRFGATVRGFEDAAARAVPGVRDVVQIPTGVAVAAESFWAAQQGREALRIDWDERSAETRGTAELREEYRALLDQPGAVARRDGEVARALDEAAHTITADFEFPYLAHAPMEPASAVVRLADGGGTCEIWTGDGDVQGDQEAAAAILGLPPDRVAIHSVYAGGSFGRRGGTALEAVEIAKAIGGAAPVKLVWTREDDITGGGYRPMYLHRVTVGLDGGGTITAWHHCIVGQSIFAGAPEWVVDGVDFVSVAGVQNIPYNIPNMLIELHSPEVGVPIRTWRGNGDNHGAYAVETVLDDIAHETGRDPLELRRTLLARDPAQKEILEFVAPEWYRAAAFAKHPRDLQVLELAAERAGWGTPLPPGRGRGLAVHYSFMSSVAYVAEVTVAQDGSFTVDRVVCAVDCGAPINPDIIRAQTEGGIAFGLSPTLHGAITLNGGRVEQLSFQDYQILRFDEMPQVEVHVVPSSEAPSGIGEAVVPPIGPAVSNAYFAATGRRLRTLPFDLSMGVAGE